MESPLADRLRPTTLDEVVGQRHLLAPGRVLRNIVDSGNLPNMIFYGPSGVGKTTVARIIAEKAGKRLHKLNGTTASTADIKGVVEELDTFAGRNGVVLYLDEIQYLNKKQQQTLLEFIENGSITLIASTTENPYFYVYNAILSRSTVFEFQPVEPQEVEKAVGRAFRLAGEIYGAGIRREEGVEKHIALACGGDVRKAINAVEILSLSALRGKEEPVVTLEEAQEVSQRSSMRYDRDGDVHYNILSAFQKSIRGSDENAALHYLARLLTAGDLLSPCRRLLVTAAEDIGLAYPQAIPIVKACVDSALQLGLPEARIPLADAVILLCTAPKSNSGILAIDAALKDVKDGKYGDVPDSLKDGHYGGAKKMGHAIGYQYAHDFPGHYVVQQYLPDAIKDREYYRFGDNKTEQAALAYRQKIRSMDR
ncbi:replication-associated recombination protein A [Merdimmobilis hominis]|uniref:Replication-associated recombination protein A n=1 Tax=uncultured Anaerotruncus sp. TaxID=905011 RepID=A0A6N2T8X8_9FIRM|nr:replication-associated recombination protein A [Merdimmobilis hominis]MCD4835937.1 replication-associated recombination protein A [Merdimmobilis hominis]PWL59868.1 MAG: replication-associated recombination protein A [Oscillospiraceae bacterium]